MKQHDLTEGKKDEVKNIEAKIIKQLSFYLPSTVEIEADIRKWTGWSKELEITRNTPLSQIYEHLVKKSGIDFYDANDKNSHIYLNCYLDIESSDMIFN